MDSALKYIEKKVVTHINDNLSDFSRSGESDEQQIKAMRLTIYDRTILKIHFLRDEFLKSRFYLVFITF